MIPGNISGMLANTTCDIDAPRLEEYGTNVKTKNKNKKKTRFPNKSLKQKQDNEKKSNVKQESGHNKQNMFGSSPTSSNTDGTTSSYEAKCCYINYMFRTLYYSSIVIIENGRNRVEL